MVLNARLAGGAGPVAVLAALCLMALPAIVPAPHSGAHIHATIAGSASARPATSVKPLSCEKLADVPGKAVTTAIVMFPPDAFSPAHRHPGDVTAFVLKGAIRSQVAGGPVVTYQAGETWFEPKGVLHDFAENASAVEPAELLAIVVADENCGPLVIPER
jgi:quercetin dioxygenase-like cupin family protein